MAERMVSQAPIQPGAAAETDLYAVPAGYEFVLASITICNTSATVADNYRLRKALAGAVSALNQSWAADQPIGPGETIIFSNAATLKATDKIRVRSTLGNCVFDIAGAEVA